MLPSVMSQPVKLSDALVLDARITGELVERSIAGQVEYWARLGRSIEQLLQGDQALALCRNAATRPLSECLESVDTAKGRERLKAYLESQPFPHYEAHPNRPGLLVRIDEDGRRTTGRFVNRQFQAVKANKPVAAK
jgi:ParD-like antitoxin of type II bacterial toxin-antitoxin system